MKRVVFFLIIFFNLSSLKSEEIANSIEADKIEYLNLDGNIKAIGSVKIIQNEYELNADEISFNQKNNIIEGNGNITLKKIGGEKILASRIKLSSDLKDGIIENPTLQTSDGINISSAYAIRTNGNSLILKKGILRYFKLVKVDLVFGIWKRAALLLINSVKVDLDTQHAGTVLGLIWVVLGPLLLLILYTLIYAVIFNVTKSNRYYIE